MHEDLAHGLKVFPVVKFMIENDLIHTVVLKTWAHHRYIYELGDYFERNTTKVYLIIVVVVVAATTTALVPVMPMTMMMTMSTAAAAAAAAASCRWRRCVMIYGRRLGRCR